MLRILLPLLLLPLPAAELVALHAAPLRVGDWAEWRIDGVAIPDDFRTATHPVLVVGAEAALVRRSAFRHRQFRQNAAGAEPEFLAEGEEELRVRHVFRSAGAMPWRLLGADGQELAAGSAEVAPAPGPTGVVQVAEDGRRLRLADGTPVVPIGCNIGWGVGPQRLDQMRQYLRRLAGHGGDHARVWLASWCGQIESDVADRYRLDHAWLIDEVLREAQRLGVRITLVLDNAHDLVHGGCFPYGKDVSARVGGFLRAPLSSQYQRRLDWLMARWGACDAILAWELFNELDMALIGQPKPMDMQDEPAVVTAWTASAADALADRDPDRRLITVSLAGQPWHGVYAAPAIDLAQVHDYVPPLPDVQAPDKDGVAKLREGLLALGEQHKPVLVSECGFQGSNTDNPANLLDPNGELLREQAWAGLLLGGYGSGMTWWWDVYLDRQDLWHVYRPLRQAVDALDWADPELAPLPHEPGAQVELLGWKSPRQALLWPRLAGDTWYSRLIDQHAHAWPDGRGPTLRLTGYAADRDYRIQGLDMASGERRYALVLRSTASGSIFLTLPADSLGTVVVVRER